MKHDIKFTPYKNYTATISYIEDFVQISDLAYGITKQLMNKHPKESLAGIDKPELKKRDLSFSMADVRIKNIDFVCGWLSFDVYATKIESSIEDVTKQAEDGNLGPILTHPETGNKLIIWPKEFQSHSIENLPPAGKSKFKRVVSVTAKTSIEIDDENHEAFDVSQQLLLSLAHSVGETEDLGTKAETMLYQSSFLLQWTAFEVFIRETIHELYRRHPAKLAKGQKGSAISLSYADILDMSNEFKSVDNLRGSLVNREIEKHKKDGASITGLINFLKSEFKFEIDPYSAWYVIQGDRRVATFNKLTEIKDVRNSMIHDAGKELNELLKLYPHLASRDGNLIVSRDYYTECFYALKSIAYSIAGNIEQDKYMCK